MDMLFGPFKTIYFDNLQRLWEHRMNEIGVSSALNRNDFPLLVFGSEHSAKTNMLPSRPLRNAIEEAMSIDKVQSRWSKLGVYPKFDRAALMSKDIRHEIIVDSNGNADVEADPESVRLKGLIELNKTACNVLDAAGYNGRLLRVEMTQFERANRQEKITVPRTRERQEFLETVKAGTGRCFLRTAGVAYNDDDIFVAQERKQLKEQLEKLEKERRSRLKTLERQEAAFVLLQDPRNESKAPEKWTQKDLKTLIAWKLNKPCPSKMSKSECLALWIELKDKAVDAMAPWSEDEEAKIQTLRQKIDGDLQLDDTQYGRSLDSKKTEMKSIFRSLSQEERCDWFGDKDNTSATALDPDDLSICSLSRDGGNV
jgi:hypothetical protein